MKSILLSLVIFLSFGINTKANADEMKNLITIHMGVMDFKQSGTKYYFDLDTNVSTQKDYTSRGQTGRGFITYQRNVIQNLYLGFSVGDNSYKGVSVGYGF